MIGAENRDVSMRKAMRKKRIADRIYRWWYSDGRSYYDNLHQYSKNKIHCSCPMCNAKTRNKGKRGKKNYSPSLNWKASDRRKLDALKYEERERVSMVNVKVIIDDCEVVGALCDTGECVNIEIVTLSREFGYEEGKEYVDALYKDKAYKSCDYSVSHFLSDEEDEKSE